MMSTKADEIGRVLAEPVVDLWKLRELAMTEGGLVNDSLRKQAWPKLVGITPDISTPCTTPQSTPPTSDITIPPSLDSEQIDRDVARVTWHLLTGNQRSRNFQMKNKHRKRIGALLKKKQRRLGDYLNLVLVQSYGDEQQEGEWGRLRYYQGYHDIASIFLSALGGATSVQTTVPVEGGVSNLQDDFSNIQEAHTAAASMGLTLACQVLQQVSRSHCRDAMRSNFNQLNAALRLIIMPLTAAFDAEVHSHLYDCEMEPFFALSWIITWFSHDVRDTSVVKRLFDFFVSSHPLMSVYMSVAMMIHPLNRIEILSTDCDFASVHNVLADLPKNSSNVGWKYIPGDEGNSGYVTGDEDEMSANEGSLFDQSFDDPDEEGGQISSSMLNHSRNARVPFQDLIDLSIRLMHKIPPRNLVNLAQRYHDEITLQPLMAQASTIALLQPPPSRCLASYADSDWVLKQKMREEHGLKLNRHQRKNRFKLVNTDVGYHGDYQVTNRKGQTKMQKLVSKAIIASGTGPDGRAEERKARKHRRMIVRSVAVALLSVFAAMAKPYFSSPARDERHNIPQQPSETKEVVIEYNIPTSKPDITSDNCQEVTCSQNDQLSDALSKGSSDNVEVGEAEVKTEVETADEHDASVCAEDESGEIESEPEASTIGTTADIAKIEKRRITVEEVERNNQPYAGPEATELYLGQRAKERRLPSPEPAPQFDFVDHLLTTFHNIEPYLEMIMGHVFKIFQLGWRRTGWALSKIAPVAEKGLIMELEDEGSSDWGNVAQQNWNRRAAMYQKNVRKVAQATTRVVRKGAKTGRDWTEKMVRDLNDGMTKKVLNHART